MLSLLLAAALAAQSQPNQTAGQPSSRLLSEAAHSIESGRLDQARMMIAKALAAGTKGEQVERLLAGLAYRAGNNAEALARYQALLAQFPNEPLLAERAGIAALKIGDSDRAGPLLDRATRAPGASWRAWNARGVAADFKRDWAGADTAYAEAVARSPDEAQVYNNMGWSKLLRGDWTNGFELLLRAAQLDPRSPIIADNLQLARTAVDADLPQRQAGESDRDWAARLNDAGVIARVRGDKAMAVAAFTRAIEARDIWFERAANNLKLAQNQQ